MTVLPDHLVLVSGDRRLEVQEVAGLGLAGVVDTPHRPVPRAPPSLVEPQRVDVDVDVDPEVDAGRPDQRGEAVEAVLGTASPSPRMTYRQCRRRSSIPARFSMCPPSETLTQRWVSSSRPVASSSRAPGRTRHRKRSPNVLRPPPWTRPARGAVARARLSGRSRPRDGRSSRSGTGAARPLAGSTGAPTPGSARARPAPPARPSPPSRPLRPSRGSRGPRSRSPSESAGA